MIWLTYKRLVFLKTLFILKKKKKSCVSYSKIYWRGTTLFSKQRESFGNSGKDILLGVV